MNFYDLHVHSEFSEGESSIEEIAKRAKLLNYKGICFATYFNDINKIKKIKEISKRISKEFGIDILIGLEAKTTEELKKLVLIRREYDILLVRGSDLLLNRKAVQTKEVDILTHPEYNRKDSGLNHVMAKLAAKNNVAIEINFREILQSSKGTRSHIIHNISENVKLCKKYKTPIIICSGAVSHWQLKDPKVLMSMGCLLGLELNEAKNALSKTPENIIKMVKERQDERWIRPGIRIVK
ncbi:MAG: RNase P subunit p30 family protein [Candidatus Aenigmarchaeota archaeon]|nr:RNase P subunit p30 family protein [Candidatus Aenigmarchaeota archaeon]